MFRDLALRGQELHVPIRASQRETGERKRGHVFDDSRATQAADVRVTADSVSWLAYSWGPRQHAHLDKVHMIVVERGHPTAPLVGFLAGATVGYGVRKAGWVQASFPIALVGTFVGGLFRPRREVVYRAPHR